MQWCRRRLVEMSEMGGSPVGFEAQNPWDFVWKSVAEDETFWTEEFKEAAQLILSKCSLLSAHLGGDAPIE
eukprot:2654863-Amphidinium_carterae.1